MKREKVAVEERRLMFELRNVNILIRRKMEASEGKRLMDNVTGTHGYIICYLKDNRERDVFQRDIEKRFSIRRSTCTNILNLMQKNGLIERSCVESDARLKKITLTKKAEELFAVLEGERRVLDELIGEGFSDSEKQQFLAYLERVSQNLSK